MIKAVRNIDAKGEDCPQLTCLTWIKPNIRPPSQVANQGTSQCGHTLSPSKYKCARMSKAPFKLVNVCRIPNGGIPISFKHNLN